MFFSGDPLAIARIFVTLPPDWSGRCTAVRIMEGVAPPLPQTFNPARQHGILCTITFHIRQTVGYLPP